MAEEGRLDGGEVETEDVHTESHEHQSAAAAGAEGRARRESQLRWLWTTANRKQAIPGENWPEKQALAGDEEDGRYKILCSLIL